MIFKNIYIIFIFRNGTHNIVCIGYQSHTFFPLLKSWATLKKTIFEFCVDDNIVI